MERDLNIKTDLPKIQHLLDRFSACLSNFAGSFVVSNSVAQEQAEMMVEEKETRNLKNHSSSSTSVAGCLLRTFRVIGERAAGRLHGLACVKRIRAFLGCSPTLLEDHAQRIVDKCSFNGKSNLEANRRRELENFNVSFSNSKFSRILV